MSDRDDAGGQYSPNEPVATGGVRTEFRGDIRAAMGLERSARRLLGHLRTIHGVNDRITDGEPGGFYTMRRQLDDGSLIEVITNDGQDTLRITCPTPSAVASTSAAPQQSRSSSDNAPTAYAASDSVELPGEEVEQAPPRKEDDEEGETERTDYAPYLWIGVRIVSGNEDDKFQVHACVWEPAAEGEQDGEILSNRNDLVDDGDDLTEVEYPLQPWAQFAPEDDKEHGIAYTDQKLFMLLERNGYPMRVPNYQDGDEDIEWDVIFISDPDNDLQIDTPNGPMAGTGSGDYYVKVMVVGADCGPDRHGSVEVEVRIITGKNGDEDDTSHKFTITQFTSYRMGILPLGWFPEQEPPDPEQTECDTCSEAVPDYGSNRHGPHWWQGMATVTLAPAQVDVPPLQVERSSTTYTDDEALPPTGFWPSGWFSHMDLCPACATEVTGVGVVAPLGDQIIETANDTSNECGGDYDCYMRIVTSYGTTAFNATMQLMKDRGISSVNAEAFYSTTGTVESAGLFRTIGVTWDNTLEHYTNQGVVHFKYSEDNCARTAAGQAHWDAYHQPDGDYHEAGAWEIAHHGSTGIALYAAFFKSVIATDQHGNVTSATLSQIGVHEWNGLIDNPPPPKCVRVEQDD